MVYSRLNGNKLNTDFREKCFNDKKEHHSFHFLLKFYLYDLSIDLSKQNKMEDNFSYDSDGQSSLFLSDCFSL